jgi:ribosomal protein S18 acetylase RimI-like enzyme
MTLRIAPARARDRERVAEIVSATGVFRAAEGAVALEVFDSAVERPGVDYFALGAFDDADRLVGFACYGQTPCTVGTWDLYWVAVDPAFQRQGTGRALMQACERAIQRRGGRLVVVETSSLPAYGPTREFYRKLGYREAARIADFYAPGDDLVVYVKYLTLSGRDRVNG